MAKSDIQVIDPKTRIKYKFYLPAFNDAYCLQRKRWYGWKTVAWVQAEAMLGSKVPLLEYLLWDEKK